MVINVQQDREVMTGAAGQHKEMKDLVAKGYLFIQGVKRTPVV
jgi:hypothetical protein